jgi:hypothetical protein
MRLRILERSRLRLSPRRWRGRSRRFTAVHSGLEALWSQGLALRMSLPEAPPRANGNGNGNGTDRGGADADGEAARAGALRHDRAHATLRQWRSYVGVFLFENVRAERVRGEFGADEIPVDDERLGGRLRDQGAEAVYDACLAELAGLAASIDDDDVLPEPRALDDAARTCDAPIEAVLAIKIRGIPRIA